MKPEYKKSGQNPRSVRLGWIAAALTSIGILAIVTFVQFGGQYAYSTVQESSGVIAPLAFIAALAFAIASYLKDRNNRLALSLAIVLGVFIFLVISLVILLAVHPLHFM